MLTLKNVIRYTLAISTLIFSFFLGRSFDDLLFFNDDNEIKSSIYDSAISDLSTKNNNKNWIYSRDALYSGRADFFRTSDVDCVRFLPLRWKYVFTVTYCKNRKTGNVTASHY
jgi:hypothetical protein